MQEEFSEIMNRLSENARFALQKADFYSKRYNNGYMGTEHLLLGIMSIDMSTGAKMIREQGATLEEEEKVLFAAYDKARYAGQLGRDELTDALIGELQLVNKKKTQ